VKYAVYGRWDHEQLVPTHAVERISERFRPDDESACVWIDAHDACTLRTSLEIEADTAENAIVLGHLAGRPTEVVVMTETEQSNWTP
jgi:hypothetical protein